jgi:hypothetical protein
MDFEDLLVPVQGAVRLEHHSDDSGNKAQNIGEILDMDMIHGKYS